MKKVKFKFTFFILAILTNTLCYSCWKNTDNPKIKAEEIIKLLKKGEDVILKNKEIIGDLDLLRAGSLLPKDEFSGQTYINPALYFYNCIFSGRLIGYNDSGKSNIVNSVVFTKSVSFIGCTFFGVVNLKNCVFENVAIFNKCSFEKVFDYQDVKCHLSFEFVNCNIKGEAFFQNIFVTQHCSFFKSVFDSTTSFQSAFFNGSAQFSDAGFHGYTDLGLCTFNSKGYFNYTKFMARSIFDNSIFKDNAEFNYATFNTAVFNESIFFLQCKFNEVIIENSLDIKSAMFLFKKPSFDKVTSINKIIR